MLRFKSEKEFTQWLSGLGKTQQESVREQLKEQEESIPVELKVIKEDENGLVSTVEEWKERTKDSETGYPVRELLWSIVLSGLIFLLLYWLWK